MRGIFIAIVGISISVSTFGQINDFLFRHFKEKKAITYGLNNRRTSILKDPSTIYSGYLGIQFGDKLKHAITLNSTVLWVGKPHETQTFEPTEAQLNFVGFSEEFEFLRHQNWCVSSYLHFGVGKARFRPIQAENPSPFHSQWIAPFEAGIHLAYSPTKWLEIRTGGGYRYVFNSGDWRLHGFYYKVGAGLNIPELKDWVVDITDILKKFKRKPFYEYTIQGL